MKRALTKNWGLKLLAFVFSVLLWIIVMNIEDPVDERTFSGIQVTVTHPEIVTNPGNTYQILDDSRTISVTVKAKRSILNKIKTDDIRATADMKNLDVRTRSLIPIDISIPSYAGRFEATANPINLRVSIELGKSETFPITATSSGTPRDGYQVGELKANPEKIKISGPESVIDSIDKVVALVDVSGQSKDEEKEAELILYDNNGKIVDSTQIENNLGDEGLKVKITMLQTKSIPVEFDTSLIGTASGYHFSGISIQPESIQIVGTEEQLETVDSIEIPAEELAEDGLDQTIEKTVDIANYLPYWAKTDQDSAGGVPIVIKIQVEKFGTKTVEFPYNSIALLNAPKDYKVSYAEQGDLEIVVRGSKEDLDDFTLEKGSVSINLNDCKTAGTYNVPIQVTLPDGIELEDTINVQITTAEIIWRKLSTKAQRAKQQLFIPTEFTGMEIDSDGFVYATNVDAEGEQSVRRLNPSGEDVIQKGAAGVSGDILWRLTGDYSGASRIIDVVVREKGIYSVIDSTRGRIFTYDHEGNLLYIFGGIGSQEGTFDTPTAIDTIGDEIIVLDGSKNLVDKYRATNYGFLINQAVGLRYDGDEASAVECWKQVLKLDSNFELAYVGIGKSYLAAGENKKAMECFKTGNNRQYYSIAYKRYRNEILKENLTGYLTAALVLIILLVLWNKIGKKKWKERRASHV